MTVNEEKLNIKTKWGYGIGSVLNVMYVAMINTYMLMFYHGVIHLSNTHAGIVMTVGKITGGISTVVVGILSDLNVDCWIYKNYGRRKVFSVNFHMSQNFV